MKPIVLLLALMLGWSCSQAPELADDLDEITTGLVKRWRKGAKQGHAMDQTALGILYSIGDGVPQDHQEAAKWFKKAAEQGDGFAQLMLGWKYAEGEGVPQDQVKALAWFTLAAAQTDEPDDILDDFKEQMTPAQFTQALAGELQKRIEDRQARKNALKKPTSPGDSRK